MATKLPDFHGLGAWWRSWELCQECPDNQSQEGAAAASLADVTWTVLIQIILQLS